jgi:polyhydroxybutyrate depolymerase
MRRVLLVLLGLGLGLWPASKIVRAAFAADSTPPETDFSHLLQPGRHTVSIHVDKYDRTFFFVTPKGFTPGDSLPLLFCFHGAGGHGEQAAETYGWIDKAEAENFFAAFPQGLPRQPNEQGRFLGNPWIWRDGRSGAPLSDVDDFHFFQVLLDQLEAALPIDKTRIYVTGFSNGAAMTFALGARFSDRIAAIAPLSSQSFGMPDRIARPLPVYYLTGTADPLIPYKGGTTTTPWGGRRTLPPVQESVDLWAKLDGCPAQPQIVSDKDGVRVLRYGPGQAASEIIFTTIEGNGHHWPGSIEPLPAAFVGPSLDPFKATDRIWEFFQKHPLTAPGKP